MRASKNTSPKKIYEPHARGAHCELAVIRKISAMGCRLVAERQKFGGVEIDLLFDRGSEGLLMVEVKSLKSAEWLEFRLPGKQKNRLERAARSLMSFGFNGRCSNAVECWLALVGYENDAVEVLPIF